jgi:fructose-1,6-bisphosphatase
LLYCLDQGLTIIIPEQERGKYIVVFRALDLESEDATYENNTPVASMFLIMKKQTTKFKPVLEKDLYQSGETVIGGGYCLYS